MEAVKPKKVCSLHFKQEDFEFIVLGKKRAALLNTAFPPIFPFPYDDELHGVAANGSAKRICLETSAAALLSSEDEEQRSAPMMFKIQDALFIPREIIVQQLQYKGGKVIRVRVKIYKIDGNKISTN
ncbi:unnamed protein product [Boreogadus saida]